jgi:hypothetical protein
MSLHFSSRRHDRLSAFGSIYPLETIRMTDEQPYEAVRPSEKDEGRCLGCLKDNAERQISRGVVGHGK